LVSRAAILARYAVPSRRRCTTVASLVVLKDKEESNANEGR
jgi:hypothetical protein